MSTFSRRRFIHASAGAAAVSLLFAARPSGAHDLWSRPQAGESRFSGQSTISEAQGCSGEVALGPSTAVGSFTPIGSSGVFVAPVAPTFAAGTVRLRPLDANANLPAGISDLLNCAVVELIGLPAGESVTVLLPARQPLAPLAEVALFANRGGRWEALEETGSATFDGQYVEFIHHGGTVAVSPGQVPRPEAP
jgi:hypothetical protein